MAAASSEEPNEANGDSKDVLHRMEKAVPHGSSSGSEDKPVEKAPEQEQQQQQQPPPAEAEAKKPSKLKELWDKSGLDM